MTHGDGEVAAAQATGTVANISDEVIGDCDFQTSRIDAALEAERSARHNEPKKYRLFREAIEKSPEMKAYRLQEGPCAVTYYDPCIICSTAQGSKIGVLDCRFYNRMLRFRHYPRLCRRLLIEDIENISTPILLENVNVGLEHFFDDDFNPDNPKEKPEATQMAAYVLQCAKRHYKDVVRREEEAIKKAVGENEEEAYFSHAFSAKQVCDACRFTILNAHFCCFKCGTELCTVCYEEIVKSDDSPHWLGSLPCLNGASHFAQMFQLGSFLPSFNIFRETLREANEQIDRYNIPSFPTCTGNHGRGCNEKLFQEEKCYCPRYSPLERFSLDDICFINDQFSNDSYAIFKAHMAAHIPIVVGNVNRHPCYRPSLWTQEAFQKILARDRNLSILDSSDFSPVMINGKPCTMKMFWSKFGSKIENGDCYMKIKDFPESKLFSDIAPEQYANLYEIMPFLEYTHVNREESGRGRLNLLNLFNGRHDRPDPGPKAYICFGLCDAPDLASTPLHMDVSDAANFLPLVKPPDGMSRQEVKDAVEKRLDEEGFEDDLKFRALLEPEKAGAIWKIFSPRDSWHLREAIKKWKMMKDEEWEGDVIHNQDVVVTREMMDFFEEEDIKCQMFVQNEGDVVFIPSGSAHQVQNIHACIKVAQDFVAPEGLYYTASIVNELRFLRAKDDLVQIDSLLHLACATATAVLKDSEPGLVTSSLPQ